MDSLDLENLSNVYGNQGGMLLLRSYSENSDFDEYLTNSNLSINGDARSRIFIGPNSDDDDRYKFFMVCAENKINALIERVREFNDNFGRSDEFEDEAVAMAIRQHGLRKNETASNISTYDEIISSDALTTSGLTDDDSDEDDVDNNEWKIKWKSHQGSKNDNIKEGFDIDDLYFLNEAVATAIEQKGLCSSTLGALN